MKTALPNHIKPYLIFWFFLNLIQAFFTELIHDEAYYWTWSRDLDWGYFDHPPIIAVVIKTGFFLFHNELGVRLLITTLSTATLWLIWEIIDDDDPKLFFTLAMSMVIIHVGGFIAVPDIPFMFFAVLFFFFWKRYLNEINSPTHHFNGGRNSEFNLNLMGITLATIGMAYSKYQGVLVVFFAILPNIKLLKRPSFWLIPLLTIIALIPHFLWQYEHEFPTFRYQFFDRSNVPYKIEFFTNYILGQILIYGPFVSFLLFYNSVKFKTKTQFEKTLKWCFYGFFGFFLIQSLKGRIEPNWTVMGIVPLMYFGYHFIKNNERQKTWLKRLFIPSIILIFIFRLYLVWDFLPQHWNVRNEFHGWDIWAETIANEADGKPVVFHNSFQLPSKYMFYSGQPAHAANYVDYAGKQYDLDIEKEENLQGKTVLDLTDYPTKDSINLGRFGIQYFHKKDNFKYFNRIKIRTGKLKMEVPLDTTLTLPIQIENPTKKDVEFDQKEIKDLSIQYCLFWYGKVEYCIPVTENFPVQKLKSGEIFDTKIKIKTPKENGEHWQFRLAIKSNGFFGRNSNFVRFDIK